ncbi:branched-chain amino acid ABC transporter permease [Minwuia thermotolerans]|uniref:branched-chain amino acid ABC transporter permease n=1 Tax=Minwuia thermotolerans TaxID=2056226 RepID=UPI000D6DC409|nr:branched-chain amino acid ABC transporter permease [Minwuia thermotolerans]
MDLWTFLQQLFNGLSMASIYMLVAVGITLVFGLTQMVNFAHGEVMMVGAYVALFAAPQGGAMFLIGLLAAVVAVGVIAFGIERGLYQFTLQSPINGFLVSLGLILIIQNLLLELWGVSPQHLEPVVGSVLQVGELRLSGQRIFVIGVTATIFAILYFLLTRTRFGIGLRAAAVDRETAGLMSINVPRMITMTFVLGGMLAATAGVLVAGLFPITPFLGSQFVIKGFAVALVGGLGNVTGAVLAALVLGVTEAMIAGFGFSAWTDVVAFGLMIFILLVRPQGFLRGTDAPY